LEASLLVYGGYEPGGIERERERERERARACKITAAKERTVSLKEALGVGGSHCFFAHCFVCIVAT
jgi:hypothetical protein